MFAGISGSQQRMKVHLWVCVCVWEAWRGVVWRGVAFIPSSTCVPPTGPQSLSGSGSTGDDMSGRVGDLSPRQDEVLTEVQM